MAKVGVRDLKNSLSRYLQRIRGGETLLVTDRGNAVAYMIPVAHPETMQWAIPLLEKRWIHWEGGKPKGLSNPPKVKGKTLGKIVLEDREE